MVTLNVGQAHILLITVTASVSLKVHGGQGGRGGFARVGLAIMQFQTRLAKKVPITGLATLSGFEVSGEGIQEIGALFLPTGSTQLGLGASMHPLGVVGFPTMSTDITSPEKSRQLGDGIVMVLVVQQDQLFVLKGSKCRDVERSLRIDQEDLVTSEGRGLTELGQGIITTWTKWDVGLVMEQESHFFLDVAPLSNGWPFGVLVHASFGDHEGSGTTEGIVVLDSYDRPFVSSQHGHGRMAWFSAPWFAFALRSMMDLRNGDLKGIVQFKLFVAVQGLG